MQHNNTLRFLALIALLFGGLSLSAQERYLDEIFSDYDSTANVTYSMNVSVFPVVTGQSPTPMPLPQKMDIYYPDGDTVSRRPVIIIAHTGTYFPPILNGGATGLKEDSALVEMCKSFARRGYVVAAMSYRKGWNAIGSGEEKRSSVLQATYRGIQDMRAAVRFFRKTAAEDNNPYSIDPDKIVVGGFGTGGYLAYGTVYLNTYAETQLAKFVDFTTTPPSPYADTALLGNVFGTSVGQINIPQYPTYSSSVSMGFAMGGAIGDSSWIDRGEAPFASIHVTEDPFAPYGIADVIEPVNNDIVVRTAAGGLGAQTQINNLGLNDAWKGVNWGDPYTAAANSRNNGLTGLMPLEVPFTPGVRQCITSIPGAPADSFQQDGGPYHWFNEMWYMGYFNAVQPMAQITAAEALCQEKLGNPNDPARSKRYLDTVINYLAPRIAFTLDLGTSVSVDKLIQQTQLSVFPNPATDRLQLSSASTHPIQRVRVFDVTGKVVADENVAASRFTLERQSWQPGLYLVQVQFREGVVTKKVLFN